MKRRADEISDSLPLSVPRRPPPGRSLAELRPDLAAQWHPTRNGELRPSDVSVASDRKVWWFCPVIHACHCPHEYEQVVGGKSRGSGCPFCCSPAKKFCEHESLGGQRPDLADQWHPTLNGVLRPSEVAVGSSRKVWWRCPVICAYGCLHDYEQSVGSKSRGNGCPFCCSPAQKVCEHDSLGGRRPDLAREWHPTQNGALQPFEVAVASNRKVWWRCPVPCVQDCFHDYEQTVANKSNGRGCPFCAGQRICGHTSLAGRRPDLADQWHPTLNGNLRPSEVAVSSSLKVWWLCTATCAHGCRHEYEQTIANKSNGNGCPFCSVSAQKFCEHDSFSGQRPDLVVQWHPTRNGTLLPTDVAVSSHQMVWWLCPATCEHDCLHEYEQTINHKSRGHGCPFCSIPAKQFCEHDSLAGQRPDLATEWHPTLNGDLQPSEVAVSSNQKVWWLCNVTCAHGCVHEYEQTPSSKSRGRGCPFCCSPAQKFCEHNSLAAHRPDLVSQWHPTLNGALLPSEVTAASEKKVWWLCSVTCAHGCRHEYKQIIGNKSRLDNGCPFCSVPVKKFCEHDSFAGQRPDLVDQWHPTRNGTLLPTDVAVSSHEKVWWLCTATCGLGCLHEYEQSVNSKSRGRGCPFCCSPVQKVCEHDSLGGQRPDLATQWHPTLNGDLWPSEVAVASDRKAWWYCATCALDYLQRIAYKSRNNAGCPGCRPVGYSRIAVEWLEHRAAQDSCFIQHALNGGEYSFDPDSRSKADGFCAATNTIYEFHGDFYHGHPKRFNPEAVNPVSKKTFGTLHAATLEREARIRTLGYNLVAIWESDWREYRRLQGAPEIEEE